MSERNAVDGVTNGSADWVAWFGGSGYSPDGVVQCLLCGYVNVPGVAECGCAAEREARAADWARHDARVAEAKRVLEAAHRDGLLPMSDAEVAAELAALEAEGGAV